uniref:FYVE-type domain-containing protein n=1 Tax=Hyaloperonospora arabidopsidis (strain Emoy2) TaxID=559515 RepID=M4BVK2_HYAAE
MAEATAVMSPPIAAVHGGVSPPSASTTSPLLMHGGSGRVAGRNLRQKVVDELKNVRVRKSPAHKDMKLMTRSSAVPPPPMPPPLQLNEDVGEHEDHDESDAQTSGKAARGGCSICERSFTVFRAKHTCRLCAQKICDDCSKNRMKLHRRLERKKGSRLCDPCARSYMQSETGSGEDTTGHADPDAALRLGRAMHNEDTRVHKRDKDHAAAGAGAGATSSAGHGKSRRHSVQSNNKKLMKVSYAQDKAWVTKFPGVAAVPNEGAGAGRMLKTRHNGERVQSYSSHLRTRHWMSLLLLAVLVMLRVIFYTWSAGTALVSDTRASSRAQLPYSFVERALDNLLSIHTLGTYLLGLVLFDELSRPRSGNGTAKKPHTRRHRRHRQRGSSSSCEHERERALSGTGVGGRRCAPDSVVPLLPDASRDEDLEVTVIEQKFDNEGVTVEKLVASLEEGVRNRAPDGNLSLECFMGTCNVICGFLGVFGRATSFAGSTVGAYFTSIDHNLEMWTEPASSTSWKEQSVKAVIEQEVGLGVADVGGKKKPSCSRCLLRLLWFIQFVEACVRLTLLDSSEDNCYNGASKAYEETLGKRHPWLVRKGVNTALGSIPTRSHILAELHKGEGDALEPLRKAHVELLRVIAELKAIFEAHGLTDIK